MLNTRRTFAIKGLSINKGVYIQDTSKNLWLPSEWPSTKTYNSCVFVTDNKCFMTDIISYDSLFSNKTCSGISNVIKHSTESSALDDFEMINNTTQILNHYNSEIFYNYDGIKNFKFNTGEKGYLPTLGYASLFLDYHLEWIEAMAIAGDTSIRDGLWEYVGSLCLNSSTFGTDYNNENRCWYCTANKNGVRKTTISYPRNTSGITIAFRDYEL